MSVKRRIDTYEEVPESVEKSKKSKDFLESPDCSYVISNIRRCSQVSEYNRLLESRSACLYEFYKKKVFGGEEDKVFTTYLTLPIVLSFVNDTKFIDNALLQVHNAFIQGTGDSEKKRDKHIKLTKTLITCNKEWNQKLRETTEISRHLNPLCVWSEKGISGFFTETLRSILFLQQIMGVIDKKSFQEGSEFFLNIEKDKVQEISEKMDKLCASRNLDNCESDSNCVRRPTSTGDFKCINKQRYRTMTPGDKSSYYVLEDPYTDSKLVYRPLCVTRIISGSSGVFQQYKIVAGKPVANGKYTIVFPPFGGSTWRDKINGFVSMYVKGYITDVKAIRSGNAPGGTVGILWGLWTAIQRWYSECGVILSKIPKNSHISIVGCSLGGALSNVASFKLIQEGFTNVHMYALGAPRVGDEKFANYINKCILSEDSANYVRFNSVIKDDTFYTEFDPVAKFPINTWSFLAPVGQHLRFVDNGRLRCMGAGMTFNPVLGTFGTQPDYDMMPYEQARRLGYNINKETPVGGDCENLFVLIHSISAYSANNFVGARDYDEDNPKYTDYFDHVINLNKENC